MCTWLLLYAANLSFTETVLWIIFETLLQIQDDYNNSNAENPDLELKQKDRLDDHSFPADKPSSEGTNHSNTSDSHEVTSLCNSPSKML